MAMTTNRNGFMMFRISAAHYLVQAIDTADAVISIRSSFWTQRHDSAGPAMMDSRHEGQPLGTAAGLCNGAGQSGIAAPERVPGCRESDPASTSATSIAAYRSGALYLGGDW